MPEHTGNNYCETLGNNLVWIITWIDDMITFVFSNHRYKPKIRDSIYFGVFY